MKYDDYLIPANSCTTADELNDLINQAANDETLSARKYYNIRHIAITTYYDNMED